jgi:alpha-glucosidase
VLSAYRTFVRWRRGQPALKSGDIRFLESPVNTIAFVREHGMSRVLAVFNFDRAITTYGLPLLSRAEALSGHGFAASKLESSRVQIPAYTAFFAALQ